MLISTATVKRPDVVVPVWPGTDRATIHETTLYRLRAAGVHPDTLHDVDRTLTEQPTSEDFFAAVLAWVRVDVHDTPPPRPTRPAPGPAKVRHVRVRDDIWTAALTLAHDQGHTLSDVIRSLLREWLRDHGREVAP